MEIEIKTMVSEYAVVPNKYLYYNVFVPNDQALQMSFLTETGKLVYKSEMDKDDAIRTCQMILKYYGY